ncbi:MAG: hypothetical protein AAFN43_10350 [Pseudomonadota bacterium]
MLEIREGFRDYSRVDCNTFWTKRFLVRVLIVALLASDVVDMNFPDRAV